MAFAIHLVSLGHHDLLNELVDDLRRQLRQPRHLSGPLNKMLKVIGLVRGGFHTCLHLRDGLFQPLLLAFQRYRQRGESFFTEKPLTHVLVTFLNQPVYFYHGLFGLLQFPLSGIQFPPLLQTKLLHLLLGELLFIDLNVPQQLLQALKYQFFNHFLSNKMGGT